MIRLTRNFGEHVYVSPDAILFVRPSKGNSDQSFISTSYESIIVTESPEEVARKVLEWRLAMERYKSLAKALASASENLNAYNNELDDQEETLLVLAGLEEPNHD